MSGRFPSPRARGGQPPEPKAAAPAPPSPRLTRPLDVTVTILGLTGVHAKDTAGASPPRLFGKTAPGRPKGNVTTTVVASFANPDGSGVPTHVPSLPLPPPPRGRAFAGPVSWPAQDAASHSRLSSYTFRADFPEGSGGAPVLVPVQVSVARNGRMFRLGSAHLFVGGDEAGRSATSVPVVDFDRAFRGQAGVAARIGGGGGVPMM